MRSWENGLYICADCGDELAQDELEEVDGGVEPVGFAPENEGKYRRVGVCVCHTCHTKRVNATAARLLGE